ncbi:MAG: bifunctional 3-(3-hydroxy-phenyl)propionate/3-hydroxycinnamic acid hydroxylase [Rhizobiales bacterium]|nr:bifunctional 3-(3-hydroxy-phenyl)propionate/3-hydroxycinnamic acid hydroxylase [Hyphomicrobiales bacterium]
MAQAGGGIKTDVLIVGMGPVGAVLAGLLGQWGVKVLVIDKETEIYRAPRAAHFDHEIMRVFQQLGITDVLAPTLRPMGSYEFRNAEGEILLRFDQGEEPTVSGWSPSYMFHQPSLEKALRDVIEAMPQVDARTGVSFVSLDRNDESGIAATIADAAGVETSVEARFIIGADGGASRVRQALGITLYDFAFDEPWLVIDTVAKDEEGLSPFGVQSCDPRRPVTIMPMSPGCRRWEFMLLPGEDPDEMLEDERIEDLLKDQVRPGQVELVRKAVYRFHGLVAHEWRKSSALLVGDAAHQMPPFMGQGLCSGVRDAANLAWKLAAVLQGRAGEKLLDSYQRERDPHVRYIIEVAIGMGKVICTLDPDAAAKRDADMIAAQKTNGAGPTPGLPPLAEGCLHASAKAGSLFPQPMIRQGGRKERLDDALCHQGWFITTHPVDVAMPEGLRAVVLGRDVEDDGLLAKWLAGVDAEAVIVRPDRYVFGTGRADDLAKAYLAAIS